VFRAEGCTKASKSSAIGASRRVGVPRHTNKTRLHRMERASIQVLSPLKYKGGEKERAKATATTPSLIPRRAMASSIATNQLCEAGLPGVQVGLDSEFAGAESLLRPSSLT
jgi:hypothetical protein